MTGRGGKLLRGVLWGSALAGAGAVGAIGWAVGTVVWPNPARAFRRWGSPSDHGLAFEEVTLSEGSGAWYVPCEGATLTAVVAHGRSRDRSWMLPLVAELASRVNVLVFDFPGHGTNGYGRTTIGLREARTVHAAIDWVADRGVGPVVVAGTSMGGVATLLALGGRDRPEVVGVVVDAVFDELTSILELGAQRMHFPHALNKAAIRISESIAGYSVAAVRPVEAIERVRPPLLLMHGRQDEIVPVACVHRLAEAATAPVRTFVYDGLHDERDHVERNRAVLDFCVERAEAVAGAGPDRARASDAG
ncbi:MAG: alpha/beta fold hydrolase [Deltaproteobacteria bacterium]|nr:MAG: alpha/beta fold hydrolase [Deltaproteobacteria bacterium]